jgi:hypothetical protein
MEPAQPPPIVLSPHLVPYAAIDEFSAEQLEMIRSNAIQTPTPELGSKFLEVSNGMYIYYPWGTRRRGYLIPYFRKALAKWCPFTAVVATMAGSGILRGVFGLTSGRSFLCVLLLTAPAFIAVMCFVVRGAPRVSRLPEQFWRSLIRTKVGVLEIRSCVVVLTLLAVLSMWESFQVTGVFAWFWVAVSAYLGWGACNWTSYWHTHEDF